MYSYTLEIITYNQLGLKIFSYKLLTLSCLYSKAFIKEEKFTSLDLVRDSFPLYRKYTAESSHINHLNVC